MIQMALASALAAGVIVAWLPGQVDFMARTNHDLVCALKTSRTCVFDGVDANKGGLDARTLKARQLKRG